GITAMGGNDEGGDSGLRRNDERSDIPQNFPQKRADIFALTYSPALFRHSLTRHSRESGNLLLS
ncbi:MAG: hypothetical protein ACR2P4_04020, partial [Gammaproteobacteria bacterium]